MKRAFLPCFVGAYQSSYGNRQNTHLDDRDFIQNLPDACILYLFKKRLKASALVTRKADLFLELGISFFPYQHV